MHLGFDLRLAGAFATGLDAQAERHVFKDRHVAEQRVMLEHKAHVAVAHVLVGGVFAAEQDVAGVGGFQPGNDAQQRGLAAAGGAQQGHQLT